MSHITRQTAIELAAQHGINAEESQLFGAGDLELLCNAAIQHYIDSAALAQPEQHPDDIAVDAMAAAMKEKLRLAREKGRGGWETCSQKDLSRMLREHVDKGDPRDVANFCAFLHALGFGIAQPEPVEPALEKEVSDLEACVRKFALEREELLVEVNRLKSQPDCRTCDHKFVDGWGHDICARSDCTNGDKYQPSKRLVLWAAAKGGAL